MSMYPTNPAEEFLESIEPILLLVLIGVFSVMIILVDCCCLPYWKQAYLKQGERNEL